MTDSHDKSIVFERDPVSLTRLEATAIGGVILTLVSMVLPWVSSGGSTVIGIVYGPISPVLSIAAIFAATVALATRWPRVRYAVIAIVGLTIAGWGGILLLGVPAIVMDAGVLVFTAGGLLVTGGGYTALSRETSMLAGTVIVWIGGLTTSTALLILSAG